MSDPKTAPGRPSRSGSRRSKTDRAQTARRPARLLAVISNRDDQKALKRILQGQQWQLFFATSCAEAIEVLTSQRIPIVMCDHDLPDGCWKDILDNSVQYRQHPTLIVSSRLADDYLWTEVLNLGGYDILSKPFDQDEVRRVIFGAWLREANPIGARAASH